MFGFTPRQSLQAGTLKAAKATGLLVPPLSQGRAFSQLGTSIGRPRDALATLDEPDGPVARDLSSAPTRLD